MKLLLLTLVSITLFSCKTTEEIQREQMVKNISVQMVQGQKLAADTNGQVQDLKEQVSNLQGKIEENNHQTNQAFEKKVKELTDKFALLEQAYNVNKKEQEELTTKFNQLKEEYDKQAKFISQVLEKLNKLSKSSKSRTKTSKNRSKSRSKRSQKKLTANQRFFGAVKQYKSGKYNTAKKEFLSLLQEKKLSADKKPRVYHNLGMISYIKKNYQDALSYFGKLFSNYPKSPYTPNGLYYLAKTFNSNKQSAEAIQTLEELIKRYPKSGRIDEAKKLLESLTKK